MDGQSTATSDVTPAQRWTEHARQILENEDRDAFAVLLAHDFAHESRRVENFGFDRAGLLDLYDSMKEMDFHITGVDVAVAGDLHVLTRRGYVSPTSARELLAISGWTAGGRLARLIEFEQDDLETALAELADVSGEPVVLIA